MTSCARTSVPKRKIVCSATVYAVVMLAFLCMQTALFPKWESFPLFGTSPDLMLIGVAGFAFFGGCGGETGSGSGAIAGMCAGFCLDALTGKTVYLSVPVYFLCGYVLGAVNAGLPDKTFRSYAIATSPMLGVRAVLTLIFTFAGGVSASMFPRVLFCSVLPEAVGTAVCAAVTFPLWKALAGGARKRYGV